MYVNENPKGYFPGGPASTGRFLFLPQSGWAKNPNFSHTNCPNVIQTWDWATPIAGYLKIEVDLLETTDDRLSRFEVLRRSRRSPARPTTSWHPASARRSPSTDLMPSYNTASQFHLLPAGTGGQVGGVQGSADLTSPSGYEPMITKIGRPSEKIYIADGARFSDAKTSPDINLNYQGTGGGAFRGRGPLDRRHPLLGPQQRKGQRVGRPGRRPNLRVSTRHAQAVARPIRTVSTAASSTATSSRWATSRPPTRTCGCRRGRPTRPTTLGCRMSVQAACGRRSKGIESRLQRDHDYRRHLANENRLAFARRAGFVWCF